jgi:hypothetical protein
MTSRDALDVVAQAFADCERKRDWAIARMHDLEKRLADLESPGELPAGEVEDLHTRLIVAERELAAAYTVIREVRFLVAKETNRGHIRLKGNIRDAVSAKRITLPEDKEVQEPVKRGRGRPPKQVQN